MSGAIDELILSNLKPTPQMDAMYGNQLAPKQGINIPGLISAVGSLGQAVMGPHQNSWQANLGGMSQALMQPQIASRYLKDLQRDPFAGVPFGLDQGTVMQVQGLASQQRQLKLQQDQLNLTKRALLENMSANTDTRKYQQTMLEKQSDAARSQAEFQIQSLKGDIQGRTEAHEDTQTHLEYLKQAGLDRLIEAGVVEGIPGSEQALASRIGIKPTADPIVDAIRQLPQGPIRGSLIQSILGESQSAKQQNDVPIPIAPSTQEPAGALERAMMGLTQDINDLPETIGNNIQNYPNAKEQMESALGQQRRMRGLIEPVAGTTYDISKFAPELNDADIKAMTSTRIGGSIPISYKGKLLMLTRVDAYKYRIDYVR